MLIYLGLSAVTALAATFLLLLSGGTPPLAVAHLAFAFGILPLIFGAISHFIPVLTRGAKAHPALFLAPLLLQIAGLSAFLYFDGDAGKGALHGAVAGALLVALVFSGWLIGRARRTLGQPHPGWAWYLAALALLSTALLAVPAMAVWPDAYRELRLLHLHLNTLGFMGLSAIGTLQVLLPTALGAPDAGASSRLRSDLWPAVGAVLALSLGAGFSQPWALAGALVLSVVGLRLGWSWIRRYGLPALVADGVASALGTALLGFLLIILFGALHAFKRVAGQDAVPAFVALFLLPLVSGALSQLLPVWRWPGPRSPARARMRAALVTGASVRSLLFLAGGIALAAGRQEGFWLAAAGLLLFVVRLIRSFFPPISTV
jgi:hypothetical protein